MSEESTKRIGRPPEGSGTKGEPERIRDYPKLLVTIRPAVRKRLRAMASVESRPAWQIVEDALELYFAKLPAESKRAIQTAAHRASVM
jgi:hypothetical protein